MSESLNIIALISGGKDSFYSILHCIRNGHKVIALGNLYPSSPTASIVLQEESDLNSWMYQTVGHTVIPLYSTALSIPLYRHEITGSAVSSSTTYSPPIEGSATNEDETESLVPLLQLIKKAHPEANAVSTGAILSTYQRTRVESVALRLGLIPLAFLWQYPILPPGDPTSLLKDMADVGLDARIIKVSGGGLNEEMLWQNVATEKGKNLIHKAVSRFSTYGDGAVLGEGGEFETLVIDGPRELFRGRIVVGDRKIVREGGGSAWLSIREAEVKSKEQDQIEVTEENRVNREVRVPDLLDEKFLTTLRAMPDYEIPTRGSSHHEAMSKDVSWKSSLCSDLDSKSTFVARKLHEGIEDEIGDLMEQMKNNLLEHKIDTTAVVSTVILLRNMIDFASINKVYGRFFAHPNPPARVTIACGDVFPVGHNVLIQATFCIGVQNAAPGRDALHVQSRSYWAPANIGPYSQARTSLIDPKSPQPSKEISTGNRHEPSIPVVHIAGQIPLIPATMALPPLVSSLPLVDNSRVEDVLSNYKLQTVLSLQHLWRIGREMNVIWWTSAVAYLSHDDINIIRLKAMLAGEAWKHQHNKADVDDSEDEEGPVDLWASRHIYQESQSRIISKDTKDLPHWPDVILPEDLKLYTPPFFAAEVDELPKESAIEWQAIFGLTKGPIKVWTPDVLEKGGAVHACFYSQSDGFATIFIFWESGSHMNDISKLINEYNDQLRVAINQELRPSNGYHQSYTAYLDIGVKGLWAADSYAGVIPCRSLWNANGDRLAAVLIFRTTMQS